MEIKSKTTTQHVNILGIINDAEVLITYYQVNGLSPEVVSATTSIGAAESDKTSASISIYQGGNKQVVLSGLTIDTNISQLLTAIEHEILNIFKSFNSES